MKQKFTEKDIEKLQDAFNEAYAIERQMRLSNNFDDDEIEAASKKTAKAFDDFKPSESSSQSRIPFQSEKLHPSMNLAERVRLLSRQYTPDLPEPVMVCSWVWTRTLEHGKEEFKCSKCGDVQVVNSLLGQMEKRICRGS